MSNTKSNSLIRDLTVGNPLKQLLIFSFPFVLANLLQQAYNITDMIIVGRFVGSAGLAGVSAGGDVAILYLFIAFGFTSAGQIVISQHIGAGERELVGKTIATLFTVLFLIGAAATALSLCICDWVLKILNVPEEALAFAHDAGIVYCWGTLPVFGYNCVSAVLRGMGDSKHPLLFVAITAVLNVGLDYLFIGPMHMACLGAALGTVISQGVSCIVGLVFLWRRREEIGFDFKLKSFRIYKTEAYPLLKLGFPLALQNAAVNISMLFINAYVNSCGVVAAAATAVANKLQMLATICTSALNTAGNSMIAQCFAAKKLKRVSLVTGSIFLISLAYCVLLSLLLILFPEQLFGIFDKDPQVLELAHQFVWIGVVGFLGFSTRAAGLALINGTGFSTLSFFTGFADSLLGRVGLSLLFGLEMGMGIRGYWLGNSLAGHFIGVVALVYFLSGNWKKRKLLV